MFVFHFNHNVGLWSEKTGRNFGQNKNPKTGAQPIWHKLTIGESETIDFKSLLFYKYPNTDNTTTKKSNFMLENGKVVSRVDVTEGWSSVNDLTPYKQPGKLNDQLMPAYGLIG